ncbi:3628_t:CDS:2, partial [Dentiscutata heterogama]
YEIAYIETIIDSVSEGDMVSDEMVLGEIVLGEMVLDENTEVVSEVVSATKKCYFINKDWNIRKLLLALKLVPSPHTGAVISNTFFKCLED